MERFILQIISKEVSKVVSCSVSPHVDPDLGIDILFEKHPLKSMYQGLGISCKPCLVF